MTDALYRSDAYLREAQGRVTGHTPEGGILVAPNLFYPQGGGQPGDSGRLVWDGGVVRIATTVVGQTGAAVMLLAEPVALPPVGAEVTQVLDWDRRYGHMKVHTSLHLLSVVVPLPVTGGQIGMQSGRLDFHMPQPPTDRPALEQALQNLVARDLEVSADFVDEAVLDSHPELVKTMSVQPPRGAGRVRLVRIGRDVTQVDLQPCGGTHVARTGEVGKLRLGKIENKGKQNRRLYVHLDS